MKRQQLAQLGRAGGGHGAASESQPPPSRRRLRGILLHVLVQCPLPTISASERRTSSSGTSSNSATSPSRRGNTRRRRPATHFLSLRITFSNSSTDQAPGATGSPKRRSNRTCRSV